MGWLVGLLVVVKETGRVGGACVRVYVLALSSHLHVGEHTALVAEDVLQMHRQRHQVLRRHLVLCIDGGGGGGGV